MKLYIYEHCPFSARVRMIFGLKKIPIETWVVMEGDAETPTRLVGRKVVPILEMDDGTAMAESMNIIRYVDAQFPPICLVEPVRADVDDWCKEAQFTVSRLAIPRMTRSAFKENATDAAKAAYIAREQRAVGDLDHLMARTPELAAEAARLLAKLELLIADWDALSETDLVLYSQLRSLSIVKGIVFGPKTRRFVNGLAMRGGVRLLDDLAI